MNKNNLALYDSWDLTIPEIPARSKLYSLEPIGVATPYTESLSSYITRLAFHHCVSPRQLIMEEIARQLKGDEFVKDFKDKPISKLLGNRNSRPSLNGMTFMTINILEALAQLTLREDIYYTTFIPWSEVIHEKRLCRQYRAWCPDCFNEWRQNATTIYEPLIWFFANIDICYIHQRRLLEICPYCNQSSSVLFSDVFVGYCPICKNWLGESPRNRNQYQRELTKEYLDYQNYIIYNIGELISIAPYLKTWLIYDDVDLNAFKYILGVNSNFRLLDNLSSDSDGKELINISLYIFRKSRKIKLDRLCSSCYKNKLPILKFLLNI
ncbi:MAG: TniQ family protein [Aulosira sp. ZfuVER01]|nr:TniQ family protein [Aulosira sp. ZfuVER01]MDZ7997713.1 TniQ family protein [Aulosira sp. DedVER01a]MDZ8052208.1 TniQ family protein [Aulosira sp. ZfuCHP01]